MTSKSDKNQIAKSYKFIEVVLGGKVGKIKSLKAMQHWAKKAVFSNYSVMMPKH